MTDIQSNSGYAVKMDDMVTKTIHEWWSNLSKEELLEYIAEQPTMTADVIRNMMANMNCVMAFDIRYATASSEAVTDFHETPQKDNRR